MSLLKIIQNLVKQKLEEKVKAEKSYKLNVMVKTSVPVIIGDTKIFPGEKKLIELSISGIYTQSPISIPVHVINGKKDGPVLLIIAGIHGDEINGIEIIRRLLRSSKFKNLNGTLIAIPIINIYGFISLSRYLPDRRDLNRSFPGSEKGSLASRLANMLMSEIIVKCTHVIDLHTGAIHRSNLPHVRANLENKNTKKIAKSFSLPIILDNKSIDGSLRQACDELNIPLILYEGGEALRFDELSIRAGVKGIRNVMHYLDMLPTRTTKKASSILPKIGKSSKWTRAPTSGIFHPMKQLGEQVEKGESIGIIVNPFGTEETSIISLTSGIIIGRNNIPMVNEGDALFHIVSFKDTSSISPKIEVLEELGPYISGPLFDIQTTK